MSTIEKARIRPHRSQGGASCHLLDLVERPVAAKIRPRRLWPSVELRDDGVRAWLVDRANDQSLELNTIARAIWELCDGRTTTHELGHAISQVFEVPQGRARDDAEQVVAEFDAAGVVTWEEVVQAPA
jgi:hypothetical protein